MDLGTTWTLDFKPGWNKHFEKFDNAVKIRILKKLEKMKHDLQGRGLQHSSFQVEEVGQYRIGFIENAMAQTKAIHFIGNHKQYEKWYLEQFKV